MYRFIFLTVIVFFCFASTRGYALTDAEHRAFSQESESFVRAEGRLNSVWRQLRQSLPAARFERILEDQRVWIHSLRDEEAKAVKGAATRADAYAKVTEDRAAVLEELLAQATAPDLGGAPLQTPSQPGPSAQAAPAKPAEDNRGLPRQPDRADAAKQTAPSPPPAQPKTVSPPVPKVPAAPPAPSLTPLALDKKTPPQPLKQSPEKAARSKTPGIEGTYIKNNGVVIVAPLPGAYSVSIRVTAPDGRWDCRAEGMGTFKDSVLSFADKDAPHDTPVIMGIESDKLIIGYEHTRFCSEGGNIGGVFVKRK